MARLQPNVPPSDPEPNQLLLVIVVTGSDQFFSADGDVHSLMDFLRGYVTHFIVALHVVLTGLASNGRRRVIGGPYAGFSRMPGRPLL